MKFINFIATIETQMFCCFKLYVKCTLQDDLFELIERQVKRFWLSLAVLPRVKNILMVICV